MSTTYIPVGSTYRIHVQEHPASGKRGSYLDFYPEHQDVESGGWFPLYDNSWLVHFDNFWLDRPQDGEERARQYIYQSMEYALIEVALQKHLNPAWYSYQEAHGIPHESPPWIADPDAFVTEQIERLNSGWRHIWHIPKRGGISRAIVPPGEE